MTSSLRRRGEHRGGHLFPPAPLGGRRYKGALRVSGGHLAGRKARILFTFWERVCGGVCSTCQQSTDFAAIAAHRQASPPPPCRGMPPTPSSTWREGCTRQLSTEGTNRHYPEPGESSCRGFDRSRQQPGQLKSHQLRDSRGGALGRPNTRAAVVTHHCHQPGCRAPRRCRRLLAVHELLEICRQTKMVSPVLLRLAAVTPSICITCHFRASTWSSSSMAVIFSEIFNSDKSYNSDNVR